MKESVLPQFLPQAPIAVVKPILSSELQNCCKRTLDMLAANNSMMVCGECRLIIKYFDDERAYRNYRDFCHSRNRPIASAKYKGWHLIMFRSYENYAK